MMRSPHTRRAPTLSAPALLGLVLLAALTPLGCGGESTYVVEDVRRIAPEPAAPGRPTTRWAYDLPTGWAVLPEKPLRILGFRVPGADANAMDGECTFSVLGGTGGGLLANVNRWRGQMGLKPETQAWVDQLPKRAGFLQRTATEIRLDGSYSGMGGQKPLENAALLGWVVTENQDAAFLKLVGPKAVVEAAGRQFAALGTSLRPVRADPPSTPAMPEGHPPMDSGLPPGHPPMPGGGATMPGGGATAPAASPPSELAWDAPEGWTKSSGHSMRAVTFKPTGAEEAECYVVLAGGDLLSNVNRWRGQLGQPPLEPSAVEALDKIPVLGGEASVVQIEGAYQNRAGKQVDPGAMLGLVLERERDSVFVKMIGPADEVLPHRAAFEAFCRSLRVRDE